MKAPARLTVSLVLLVLAALLAAGCGGDGDSGSDDGGSGGSETAAKSDDGGDGARDCDGGSDAGATGDMKFDSAPEFTIDEGATYTATLETSAGTMTAEILPEEGPCAANNFVFLANEGYYKDIPFHRIIKDFMVQTGDPTGTGGGGPGYSIKDDEVSAEYEPGTLAMANAGPDTGGSQFFIVHGTSVALPPNYAIFGKVTEGLDVLDTIANTPVADNGLGETSKPTKPVTLKSVKVAQS